MYDKASYFGAAVNEQWRILHTNSSLIRSGSNLRSLISLAALSNAEYTYDGIARPNGYFMTSPSFVNNTPYYYSILVLLFACGSGGWFVVCLFVHSNTCSLASRRPGPGHVRAYAGFLVT